MKTCSKCKVEKDESEFYKAKANKDGLQYKCKSCKREIQIEYKSRHNELNRKKRSVDIESFHRREKKYRDSEKAKTLAFERNKKYTEKMDDKYILKCASLKTLRKEHITPELIEFTRLSIRIKRLIKEKRQCATSTN